MEPVEGVGEVEDVESREGMEWLYETEIPGRLDLVWGIGQKEPYPVWGWTVGEQESDLETENSPESITDEIPQEKKCIVEETIEFLKRFIFFKDEEVYLLLALWLIGTHLHDQFEFYGYFFFHSADSQSGKSTVLNVASELVFNSTGVLTSITEAVLFRIAHGRIQLLDEVDSLLNIKSLKGILNSGFSRKGKAMRMEQNKSGEWKVKEFPVYAPRALSGIGADILEKTTRDRTFMVQMVPQRIEEMREIFMTIDPEIMEDATVLKGAIVVWAEHKKEAVFETYRKMNFPYLKNFRNRTMDISNSLAAILETAYEGHPKLVQARRDFIKAIALTREEKADKTLRDIHILRTLLCLPPENEDPLIGMASELVERCRVAGEEVSEEEISGVLSKHGFKKKSKRKGGEPRKRYVVERERLRDIIERLAGSGLDGEGA